MCAVKIIILSQKERKARVNYARSNVLLCHWSKFEGKWFLTLCCVPWPEVVKSHELKHFYICKFKSNKTAHHILRVFVIISSWFDNIRFPFGWSDNDSFDIKFRIIFFNSRLKRYLKLNTMMWVHLSNKIIQVISLKNWLQYVSHSNLYVYSMQIDILT